MSRLIAVTLVMLCAAPAPSSAQATLSLADAIARARAQNPDAAAAASAESEAAQRVLQARSGYLPKVDLQESWQRSDAPGFVFGARLGAREIGPSNLTPDALNHPAAADSFRSALSIEQPLFDRAIGANLTAASIARGMAATARSLVDQELSAAVTDAFGAVLIAAAAKRAAAAAVDAARADRALAGHRRDAGLVTDADVLQLELHLARALERQAAAAGNERVARAQLNQLMGEPLSAQFALEMAPPAVAINAADAQALEAEAVKNRPEVALARRREDLAAAGAVSAQAAFLPRVLGQAGWEFTGRGWGARSSSWAVGIAARINVFNGFADRARLAEARQLQARRVIERNDAETRARLDVEIALARLDAARAAESVGRAAAGQARENQRITRDRYAAGLADIATVLRAADLVEQADAQQTAARVSVLTATAALLRAIGRS